MQTDKWDNSNKITTRIQTDKNLFESFLHLFESIPYLSESSQLKVYSYAYLTTKNTVIGTDTNVEISRWYKFQIYSSN